MKINIVNSSPKLLSPKDNIYLVTDKWNDYLFETLFYLYVVVENKPIRIGEIKIGFVGQTEEISTRRKLNGLDLSYLPENFFSLGGDEEYYENIAKLDDSLKKLVLKALNDIVFNEEVIPKIKHEEVFKTSLLRFVSLTTIKEKYKRILTGDSSPTDFSFFFERSGVENLSDIRLDFEVTAESIPSTNIHAMIGRNGIGKTTILNGMIDSIANPNKKSQLFTKNLFNDRKVIDKEFFSTLISVSFSAFDPFEPPEEQPNPALGTCYYYIGLKNEGMSDELKSINEFYSSNFKMQHLEFAKFLVQIKSERYRVGKWKEAMQTLESDKNFAEMNLVDLLKFRPEEIKYQAMNTISKMSSGHAIVLLTITGLVRRVEEKSLVLIDEPESHLHPPLLSAFIRTLSNLLTSRNGVAIIATHSPVVLQEIPKSCAWKINRYGSICKTTRPETETFGENVGILTRDVFGLEVEKSGFYSLLNNSVSTGKSFTEIMHEYNQQLGTEGRVILAMLIASRDRSGDSVKDL